MKLFFVSCCGVTVTARASRPSSFTSRLPAGGQSGQKIISPARREESFTSFVLATHGRGSPSSSSSSSSSSRRLSATTTRRLSSNSRVVVRQTRSELGVESLPRRKSMRPMGSACSALPYIEWTPSLCTISEDKVVVVRRRSVRDRMASIERSVNGKSGREMLGVQSRSRIDDSGRASVTVIPTYAPTPFMF